MDKYQLFALNNAGYGVWKDETFDEKSRMDRSDRNWSIIPETDNKIYIKQDENYNIVKYFLRFQTTVSKVVANENVYEQRKIENSSYSSVVVPIDFNDRINEVEIHIHDVIDPIKISVEYIEANKHIYDSKVIKANQAMLEKSAAIKVSTGADLVNIYFQPCSGSYDNTVIELYLANGTYSKLAPGAYPKDYVFRPQLLSATPGQMIAKFKVEDGMLFKSITGLAKGAYGFKLSQYDKNGKLLFVTDYQYFQIV